MCNLHRFYVFTALGPVEKIRQQIKGGRDIPFRLSVLSVSVCKCKVPNKKVFLSVSKFGVIFRIRRLLR